MNYFVCPECGWSLEGGDELGVCMYDDKGDAPDAYRYNFCFHCGYKIPEPDSLEKICNDIIDAIDVLETSPYKGTHDRLLMIADRLAALAKRNVL